MWVTYVSSINNNDLNEENNESESEEKREDEKDWVDWEDQILEDTVPLVGFVRMLLHSGKAISTKYHLDVNLCSVIYQRQMDSNTVSRSDAT
ncbi:hypothetical protein IFM89_023777 [Coptis chinensis]|uniref:Uncharacterized protein n=1 Tax=Coptis chinensis TaxID=261450 RepID=A0A835ISR3_9MAGN|nr:hypothetical protein IFM89_025035 [Coptis chinensis]KAF9621602.1 hypothetical protein IFM89_023777 [Coptis chinensis]